MAHCSCYFGYSHEGAAGKSIYPSKQFKRQVHKVWQRGQSGLAGGLERDCTDHI